MAFMSPALTNVPHAHLAHLLRSLTKSQGGEIPDEKIEALVHKTRVVEERKEALRFIEKHVPGTVARLADMWFFSGRRTIHLWEFPMFVNEGPVDMLNRKEDRFVTSKNAGRWIEVTGELGEDRIVGVMADPENKLAMARAILHSTHSFTDVYGHRKSEVVTSEVGMRMDFKYKHPLLEVHSSIQPARKAMFCFFDWLFNWEVPRRKSKQQEEVLKEVVFTREQIWSLAGNLQWENVIVDGLDPTAEVGEAALRGKWVGTHRQALDGTKQKVREQQSAPNDLYAFNIYHVHDDQYQEVAEVSFNFAAKPAHITFSRAVSRPVIDYVLERVYTFVAQGERR